MDLYWFLGYGLDIAGIFSLNPLVLACGLVINFSGYACDIAGCEFADQPIDATIPVVREKDYKGQDYFWGFSFIRPIGYFE